MRDLLERLNDVGFERPRRAVAALALSLFVSLYLLLAVVLYLNDGEAWVPVFLGFAACYAVAFMGVAAEWFWGRWFAEGIGFSGIMVAVGTMVLMGAWNPVLGVFGAMHLLVIVMLAGKKMAARYDLQPAWRERYGMDEFGVARLRKTVTRASASLPSLIVAALGPKEGQGMAVAGVVAVVLAVAGLRGVVRLRTWGLVALGAAAALVLATGDVLNPTLGLSTAMPGALGLGPAMAGVFLLVAVAPFVGPAVRYLRR